MKTTKTWSACCGLTLFTFWLTACPIDFKSEDKDDAQDGGPGPNNKPLGQDGVDSKRDAKGLSNDEARRVCESVTSGQTPEQRCTIAGLHAASTQAMCEQIKSQCVAHMAQSAQPSDCNGAEVSMGLASCANVTIGEIKECFAQSLAAEKQLTCADAGKPPPELQCAKTLASRCPDLFDAMGMGMLPGGIDFDADGGLPDPRLPPPQGGAPGGNLAECPSGSGSSAAAPVDCGTFCIAVATPACQEGPNAEQCLGSCEAAKLKCPGAIAALAGCSAAAVANHIDWTCDAQGKPRIEGACGKEFGCFAGCLGAGNPMQMMSPPMQPMPMQPMPPMPR